MAMSIRTVVWALCLLFVVVLVRGTVYNLTPSSQWLSTLSNLQPGDSAYLHGGLYSKTAKLTLRLVGTAAAPILISGFLNETKPVINHTDNSQNIIDLVEGNYFTIQYLELTGGSLGLRLGPSANNTLNNGIIQNLTVHDLPETAISANFPNHVYSNLTFRYNEIYNTGSDTGECFYLGCVNGACIIHDSEVSNNLVHDTLLATAGSVGSAIQIKDLSYNNLVKDNVCYNLGGPCVLLYTDGGKGRNVAIGNVMLGGNDNGIQAAQGATLINNLIMNTKGDGIAIVQNPSGTTIANITILHNTVVNASGYCLRATNFVSTYSFLISNNAFYCPSTSAISASGSQTGVPYYNNGYLGGSPPNGVSANAFFALGSISADLQGYSYPNGYNLYPTSTSSLINRGNGSYSVGYDFNYNTRSATTPTVGAYEYTGATNNGWTLLKGFKAVPSTSVPSPSPAAGSSPNQQSSQPQTSGTGSANNLSSWITKLIR